MNRYFTNPIFSVHNYVLPVFRPLNFANEPYLRKKLSDYYFSRLIPDFYYESKLNWKYSPYVLSSRILVTIASFMTFYYLIYYRSVKNDKTKVKKYKWALYAQPFIKYEKAILENEKKNSVKLFF